ncbi:hypothetical protein E2C01_005037 [Portunus trituberculatus]|uniref:Uncharacterized protein n=1 Tax=Portunus trituberculatus TaxID=210409 RepID=A0A5B7CS39_PORTR|nr:hypothetical protein [Portunus trituberculatus]
MEKDYQISEQSFQDLWSAEKELPRKDYNGVMHGNKDLMDFFVTVEKEDVVVLTDAARESKVVLTIINNIGHVSPTHYRAGKDILQSVLLYPAGERKR